MSRKRYLLLVIISLLILLSGCMPGDGSYTKDNPAGFLSGIWHGWLAPLSLLWSLLNPEIRIYEPINTGWWYDFGFYMAIISGFGGLSLSRKKARGK